MLFAGFGIRAELCQGLLDLKHRIHLTVEVSKLVREIWSSSVVQKAVEVSVGSISRKSDDARFITF